MALISNPLFLQTGRYRALEDRYLVGAFTAPAGTTPSGAQQPRHGVLPAARDASGDAKDLSFMVTAASDPNTDPQVRKIQIYRGAAVVGGKSGDGLEGAYLVINDGNFNETIASSTVGARFSVYLHVLDAEKEFGAPTDATATKARIDVVASADPQPTEMSLLLAEITIGAGNDDVTVTDRRVFTSSHGGSILVSSSIELTSDSELDLAPLGTIAHVGPEGKTYIRGKSGWAQVSQVSSGATAGIPAASTANSGELWFDSEASTLLVKGASEWLPVHETRALIKRGLEGSYGTNRHRHFVNSGDFRMERASSTTLTTIDGFVGIAITGNRPNNDDLRFYVKVTGGQTIVRATMALDVQVTKTDGAITAGFFNVAWELRKGTGWTTEVPQYTMGASYNATSRYGLRWFSGQDYFKSRTVTYALDPGEYRLQPVFFLASTDGTTPLRALVNNLYFDVVV